MGYKAWEIEECFPRVKGPQSSVSNTEANMQAVQLLLFSFGLSDQHHLHIWLCSEESSLSAYVTQLLLEVT